MSHFTSLAILNPKQDFSITRAISQLPALGAESIGLRRVKEVTHFRTARNGNSDTNKIQFDIGIMVEVLYRGQVTYSATADLSQSGIERAYRRALGLATAGQGFGIFAFTKNQRPKATGQYFSPRKINLIDKSLQQFTDELCRASQTLKVSDKIISTVADAILVETEIEYANTEGTHVFQDFLLTSLSYSATAHHNGESQTRNLWGPRGYTRQSGLEALGEFGLAPQLTKVGEEAVELLSAPNCPTEVCDLLLMPDQMYIQIHESIGHPLELDRILGDERNFAGWSFVKAEDFGKLQFGSELMNVSFDPTVQNQFASYAFDDCGTPARREMLIENGKLLRGLGGLESQARLQKPGVANFRASSWSRAPIDRMANINLEPGDSSLAEMIASTENGMIMESNISWSIDDYRNKFQFGCEVGHKIKDGQIIGKVKNPNYRSSTLNFWSNLKGVGNATELQSCGSPYCGKGEPSQLIRVGHASPPCLFDQIEIFGGGK